MTPSELRFQFLEFSGRERFRRFVRSLYKRSSDPVSFDRLKYWQEVLWARFITSFPDAPTDVNEIGSCLHWCDLHNTSLVAGAGHQPIDLRHSELFDTAEVAEFPHGCGWLTHHCPACRTSCIRWISDHPIECRILQYRIHDPEWVTMHKNDPDFRQMCRDRNLPWNEILPGDEIWAIDTGRGSPGIGLVRDGCVVPLLD